jgi:phosphate starvation-inducible membrane PsiE
VKGDTSNFGTILRILMDAKLQVLSKGLIELGIILLVLSNLVEQLYTLFHYVFSDDLQAKYNHYQTPGIPSLKQKVTN